MSGPFVSIESLTWHQQCDLASGLLSDGRAAVASLCAEPLELPQCTGQSESAETAHAQALAVHVQHCDGTLTIKRDKEDFLAFTIFLSFSIFFFKLKGRESKIRN